jgi:phenylalanyl-tRNA synthetase alpha chain
MYKGEREILELLAKKKRADFDSISEATGLHKDTVRRAVESLRGKGFVEVKKEEYSIAAVARELEEYAKKGFPEFSVFKKAGEKKSVSDLNETEKRIGLVWAKKKGFVGIEKGKLIQTKNPADVEKERQLMLETYRQIKTTGKTEHAVVLDGFFHRRLVQRKTAKKLFAEYTGKAVERIKEEKFNVSIEGKDAPLGKKHPLTKMSDRIKEIMGELGFEEMEGSVVESAFWNFDALFQPQDHPARELADTFYLEGKSKLPEDRKLVERVKEAHERGWKYKWSREEAEKTVLRTHTTCLSARYLAAMKDKKPKKYFAVGRVFRNEATDYSHLAEFNQVEGIIAWEGATFRDLLGVLKEIYKKLGFEKIRFRPSYFPYTEPSLEVEVFFEDKKQWMELGGAGIFRPEVSIPLAGVYPVLAWGLSLERPLMILLDMKDIRDFYKNDLSFLRSAKLRI